MARGKKKVAVDAGPVEGPWELPEGWRWERLGDLGEWFGGGTPSKSNIGFWTDGNIPWISPKDMKRFDLDDTQDHITEAALAGSSTKLIPAKSVVCVMRSGILKHSFPVALTTRPMTLNQDLRAIHPRAGIAPRYLAYFLRSAAQFILHECSKDGTTVDSIEAGRLMQVPVPIPVERSRQEAITARIDALFAEIDEGEAALAEVRAGVETYRKALLKAAVTGELTADWRQHNPPTETGEQLLQRILADRRARWHTDPKNARKKYKEPAGPETDGLPELPEGWVWATVEQTRSHETSAISDGPFGSNLKSVHYRDAGPRVVRLQNIGKNGIFVNVSSHISSEHFATLERHHVQSDDLVVAILGSPLPRAVILPKDIGPALVKADCIKVRLDSNISTKFVWMWINSLIVHHFFSHDVKGVGRPRIGMTQIKNMPVPVPSTEEVVQINARVADGLTLVDSTLSQHLEWGEKLSQLRQSILAAAFRGELAI